MSSGPGGLSRWRRARARSTTGLDNKENAPTMLDALLDFLFGPVLVPAPVPVRSDNTRR